MITRTLVRVCVHKDILYMMQERFIYGFANVHVIYFRD